MRMKWRSDKTTESTWPNRTDRLVSANATDSCLKAILALVAILYRTSRKVSMLARMAWLQERQSLMDEIT